MRNRNQTTQQIYTVVLNLKINLIHNIRRAYIFCFAYFVYCLSHLTYTMQMHEKLDIFAKTLNQQ